MLSRSTGSEIRQCVGRENLGDLLAKLLADQFRVLEKFGR